MPYTCMTCGRATVNVDPPPMVGSNPPHRLGEPAYDRKAKPGSSCHAGLRIVELSEALENVVVQLVRDTRPVICDRHPHLRAGWPCSDLDTAVWSVFSRRFQSD